MCRRLAAWMCCWCRRSTTQPPPPKGRTPFFTRLPAARRVQVPGDYQHGVYPYRDRCVDPLVTRYLLGEPPIQRDTACPAHTLEMDARPPVALAQRQSAQSVQSGPANPAPSAYRNPQQAEMLIDAFKRGLQPRTRQGFEASRLKG